eukprot:Hpha_TRINITY_DN14719_c0_g1::TRINITY_DN14719_c0_g1_i1::g.102507::m.102507/K14016/UFD1; ubiquitin fusion degradation protein 1
MAFVTQERLRRWQNGGNKFCAISPSMCTHISDQQAKMIEHGGKIDLPNSAIGELAHCNVQYPMMFKIWSDKNPGRYTHCGVREFTAEEGSATVPWWMMQLLGVQQQDMILVQSAKPKQGSYVKLRPQKKAFTDLHDPRAILETYLRNFSCLTRGDTIRIHYLEKDYDIDIVEVKAQGHEIVDCISIVESDINVDFAPPADMDEHAPPPKPSPATPAAGSGLVFGSVLGQGAVNNLGEAGAPATKAPAAAAEPAPKAFGGAGRSLKGNTSSGRPSGGAAAAAPAAGGPSPAAAAALARQQAQAQKKVDSFGRELKDQGKEEKAAPQSAPFSGQGRTLGGGAAAPAAPSGPVEVKRDSYGRVLKDQSEAATAASAILRQAEFKAFTGSGRTMS